jgi:predicted  nucleic acid-binding Zn-ribbon protein
VESAINRGTGVFRPITRAGADVQPDRAPSLASRVSSGPNITVEASVVRRVGRVFQNSTAGGSSIGVSLHEDKSRKLQEAYHSVVEILDDTDLLVDCDGIPTIVPSQLTVSYSKQEGGSTIKVTKSILQHVKENPSLMEKIVELENVLLSNMGRAPVSAENILRKCERKEGKVSQPFVKSGSNDDAYVAKQKELQELNEKIAGIERKITASGDAKEIKSLKAEIKHWEENKQKVKDFLETSPLHEKIPTQIKDLKEEALTLAKRYKSSNLDVDEVKRRCEIASQYIEKIMQFLSQKISAKVAEIASSSNPADKTRLEKELSSLKSEISRFEKVDVFALAMALAHYPKKDRVSHASLDDAAKELHKKCDECCRDIYKECSEAYARKHEKPWYKAMFSSSTPEPLVVYNDRYAKDVGGLLFSGSNDPDVRALYAKYCNDLYIDASSLHLTDKLLRVVIDAEQMEVFSLNQNLSNLLGESLQQEFIQSQNPASPTR